MLAGGSGTLALRLLSAAAASASPQQGTASAVRCLSTLARLVASDHGSSWQPCSSQGPPCCSASLAVQHNSFSQQQPLHLQNCQQQHVRGFLSGLSAPASRVHTERRLMG